MARGVAITAALAASLLAVSGAGGAPAQTPKRGGTVVWAGPFGEPACFTFFREECAPGSTALILGVVGGKVLEGPFDVGPDFELRERLVTSAEYTRRKPFTVTYRIRPEARWSDGVPITARDFVFTVATAKKLAAEDDWLRTKVESVRALDRKTVRLVLRSRFAGWRQFGSVLPAHALAGEDLTRIWTDRIDNPKTGAPIGSGPFLVERWERGKQIVLRRNPNYWGRPAFLDRLVVRFNAQGPALAGLFRGGDIDVASNFPPGFVPALRQEPGVRVLSNQLGAGWDHFEIRVGPGGHPALRNKLVRRALAYGLDRVAIVDRFLKETNPAAVPRDSAIFPERSRYYRRNWQRYRHRPAEARRLLEQAGCRRSVEGIYGCGGRPLSLQFITTTLAGGFRPGVLELAQAQLRQIGVQVVPTIAPTNALFNQILAEGKFDVALFAWISGPDPADAKDLFACGGELNWTGYCQRLVTADLDQAQRILDPEQQARVLNRVDAQMSRDVPVIPLYQQPQLIAVRESVRNVRLALTSQSNPIWNAEDWWLDR